MECTGTETSHVNCSHSGWGVVSSNCNSHTEDIVVQCSGYKVRLQNGKTPNEGRVEVKYGTWGTICDENFGIREANVTCKMLGYELGAVAKKTFGARQSSKPIWMKGVSCFGNETSIGHCNSSSLKSQTCSHAFDVGVICKADSTPGKPTLNVLGDEKVEVEYYGIKRSICYEGWDIEDARVVCRMKGFDTAAYTTAIASGGNSESIEVWILNMNCQGYEENISECNIVWNFENKPCPSDKRGGVVCKTDEVKVRLVDGSFPHRGRLEVKFQREWGTVCDHGWNIEDSNVICRMLGYPKALATKKFSPGKSSQPIFLSNVSCVGCERSINDCRHSGWRSNTCSHSNDVGIECLPKVPANLKVNIKTDGRVEISYYNVSRSICYNGWHVQDARVICRMKGFDDVAYIAKIANQKGDVWFLNMDCKGNEENITRCHNSWNWENKPCPSSIRAGVKCRRDSDPIDVKFRLHFSGKQAVKYSGRLSVNYYGTWGNLCAKDLKLQDAHVICRMLNFTEALTISHWDKESSNDSFELLNHCNGTEESMKDCKGLRIVQRDNTCKNDNFAGIVCNPKNKDQKQADHIRLVGGADGSEGRVEIQKHGVWGTICNSDWDMLEANVICRMKNYAGGFTAYKQFEEGTGPIWLSGLKCEGKEEDIENCYSDGLDKTTSCNHGMDAGVVCYNSSVKLKVKLHRRTSKYNGRVKIIFNGSERSICGDGWGIEDARVVCRMLDYKGAVAAVSHFGGGPDKIWLSNVSCTGNEKSLEMCNHSGWGNSFCRHNHYAGVICKEDEGKHDANINVIFKNDISTPSNLKRVEVTYHGIRGTISANNWGLADAHVVCWMKGLGKASKAGPISRTGNDPILIDGLNCSGSEVNIEDCIPKWGISNGDHPNDAGILCNKVTEEEKKSMTANIILKTKYPGFGEVELIYNKTKTAICGSNWDIKDADVICKMKNFKYGALAAIKQFTINKDKPWLTGFACRGKEQTIGECARVSTSTVCPGNLSAGVMCKNNEGTRHAVQVRLIGGISEVSGRVEISYGSVWGAVCNDGNSKDNARVICHMLGYVDVSTHGPTSKPSKQFTWLGNIECDGTEKSIENCKPKWGEATCNDDNVLRVTCKIADAPQFEISEKDITDSTVKIGFPNVQPLPEALKGVYQIAVDIGSYGKRLQSDKKEKPFIFREVNHTISAQNPNYTSYVTAEVTSSYLAENKNFIIGDIDFKERKEKKDGFENKELQPKSTYRVYVRIVTESMDKRRVYGRYSYVAFKTKPVFAKGQAQKLSSSRGGGAVIGMSIVIIMLIAVIICASVWFIRKNRNEVIDCYDKTEGLEMTNNGGMRTVNDIPEGYYQAPLRDERNEYVTSPDKDRAAYQSLVTRTRVTRNKQQENESPLYVEIRS